MGIYASYIAVPVPVLERMRDESGSPVELWEWVERPQEEAAEEDWFLGVGKAWDRLWWLLDPARRSGGWPGNVLGRAVVGARTLNPAYSRAHEDDWPPASPEEIHVMTRYLDAAEVQEAAEALRSLTPQVVVDLDDPAEREAAAGYLLASWSPPALANSLRGLATFYERAAERGWAVVVGIG